MAIRWAYGSELVESEQREVLSSFVYRFTREHVPSWAKGTDYSPQFASDREWLENTRFPVRKDGRLDRRYHHCESNPTWPDGMI